MHSPDKGPGPCCCMASAFCLCLRPSIRDGEPDGLGEGTAALRCRYLRPTLRCGPASDLSKACQLVRLGLRKCAELSHSCQALQYLSLPCTLCSALQPTACLQRLL